MTDGKRDEMQGYREAGTALWHLAQFGPAGVWLCPSVGGDAWL